jgi:ribosome maturation factor RimP
MNRLRKEVPPSSGCRAGRPSGGILLLPLSHGTTSLRRQSAVFRGVAFTGRLFLLPKPDHDDRESDDAASDTAPGTPDLTGGLEARLARAVEPTLTGMGYELVRVQVSGTRTPTVQIMADRADGAMIGVEDCEAISHAVGAVLDVEDPFSGEWNLEVSSAGIDRPLTRTKDWLRFAGHVATVELLVPQDGRRRWKGRILAADENEVRLRLDEGGEAVIPCDTIRRAKLVLTDELIAATAAETAGEAGDAEEADEQPRRKPHAKRN